MATFPLRVVFMKVNKEAECKAKGAAEQTSVLPPVQMLVSVPKKRFRHAVDRNRMKRMIREAYRTNKHILWEGLEGKDYRVVLAYLCITDTLPSFRSVNKSVKKSLTRIAENLTEK